MQSSIILLEIKKSPSFCKHNLNHIEQNYHGQRWKSHLILGRHYNAMSTSYSCSSGTAPKPDLSNLAKSFLYSWCFYSKLDHCSQALLPPINARIIWGSMCHLQSRPWCIRSDPFSHFPSFFSLSLPLIISSFCMQPHHPDKGIILMLSTYSLFNSTSRTLLHFLFCLCPSKFALYTQ